MFKLLKNLRKKDYIYLLAAVGLIVLQVYLDLALPDYTAKIIQELYKIGVGGTVEMSVILINGGIMIAMAFGSLASAIIVGFLAAQIASGLGFTVRERVYDKIQSFSLHEINRFSTASLITRTTNDIRQVTMIVAFGMQALVKAPIMAVYAIIKIVNKSWQWSLATGIVLLILAIFIITIMLLVLPKFRKMQTLTDNLNRVTRENLTGIRVVRASNAENFEKEKFEKSNDELTNANLYVGKRMALFDPVMTILMSGLTLSIYWIGAYIVKDAQTFSSMTVFVSYSMQVIMSFMMLIVIFMLLPRALVSAKRINEVLDTENQIISGDYSDVHDGTGTVEFRNVSFKYPDADKYVLHDISFTANEGETVAFIGSTGSGKSTLINLIPRLYDVTDGEVVIDGINVKDYNLEALNKKIGYVPQRGVLFSGTVADNVNFGDNEADEKTIAHAISVAQATNFVNRMEGGVDAKISQGGTNVSGGQKQRLSIARAIARKPEILIFDDSFSALDYKTDKKLRSALKKHTEKVTKFIVAQRIGTIREADKIIVLDEGNMVGIGTHDQLLKTCPVYKEIALSQLSKEEL
ncbi:MAG: ABC transporter ATP-binding protein [Clostridia bacterium]|nr:ABC transporter ATP-binding protein [Clostridia bacterium]